MSDDNRRSPVSPDWSLSRITQIRERVARKEAVGWSGSDDRWLLDYIDTLTAERDSLRLRNTELLNDRSVWGGIAEKAEAERDALRAAISSIDAELGQFDRTGRLDAHHKPGSIYQGRLEGERMVVERIRALLDNSPPPVEGGESDV